jgi:phenylalanine-4-hydroxylase
LAKAASLLSKQTTLGATTASYELPFDLNQIFSLTYEIQPLKEVLEFILLNLKKADDKIHAVDTKVVSKMMMLDKYNYAFDVD